MSDHEDWTIVEPIEALTPTAVQAANSTGAHRCKTTTPRLFADQASQRESRDQPSCASSDTRDHQQRRHVDISEPVQVSRGAW